MYPYTIVFGMGLYDIFLMVGLLVVLFSVDKMGIKRGFSVKMQKLIIVDGVLSVLIGLLGAVLFQAFYDFIQTGKFVIGASTGMTFYGGFIFGVLAFLAIYFIGGKKIGIGEEVKRRFPQMADIAACLIPLGHGFGRLGCFFAGCCHGRATDAWYGVKMWTESGWQKVVPVQLYEAILLFALSALLFWLYFSRKEEKRIPLLPIYGGVYGVWRFVIEFFRADDRGATIIPFLSPSQLVAILLVGVAVAYFVFWWRKKDNVAKEEKVEDNKEV